MRFIRQIILLFCFLSLHFSYAQIHDSNMMDLNYDSINVINEPFLNPTNCPKLDSIIQFALNQRGKHYKFGTFGPNTFDCSGLMYYTFSQFGIQLGRSSRDQYLQGVKVDIVDIQPGDLVFYYRGKRSKNYIGHVGLVVSVDSSKNFTFVHSSTPKTGVRLDYSQRPGYVNTFVGARRIVHCDEMMSPRIIINENKTPEQRFTNSEKPNSGQNSSNTEKKTYIVKQGDTLYGISKKHKISVEQILKNNALKSDKIYPGQKLKL